LLKISLCFISQRFSFVKSSLVGNKFDSSSKKVINLNFKKKMHLIL
jgi:hypothetical protein